MAAATEKQFFSESENVSQDSHVNLLPKREMCQYTSCYCEENVWQLCDAVKKTHPEKLCDCYAVFISNNNRTVPLWFQKSAGNEEGSVCWDYHVIFIQKCAGDSGVYDLDTTLDFPCKFTEYFDKAIRSNVQLLKQFHRLFRVISAEKYLKNFASDRSHMINEDKTWRSEPPPYPCIQTTECSNNIDDFISMDLSKSWGEVLDEIKFVSKFTAC